MKNIIRLALAALLLAPSLASAADVRIAEIRAYLWLERSGKLSGNLVGSKEPLFNTIIGEGSAGEPANNLLVEIVIAGDRNSAPKHASAIVNLTQAGKGGQKSVTKKGLGGFLFGDSGMVHKSIFLENATCSALEIEVKVGKAAKSAKLDFQCGE